MRFIVFILIFFFPLLSRETVGELYAQQKVVQYDRDFVFRDGVYLSFSNFKNNSPIPVSRIVFESNKSARDYLQKALEKNTLTYLDSAGKQQEVKTNTVWGYCENGTIYINHGTDFNRMVVIGSFSHFIATIAVRTSSDPFGYGNGFGMGNYGYGYTPAPRYMYVSVQFILDFDSGQFIEFNADNMEILLQRDEALHTEFMALKKRKRRDTIFLYLRKYNEKHPIFFPE